MSIQRHLEIKEKALNVGEGQVQLSEKAPRPSL